MSKKIVKVYLPNNEIRRFQINDKSFKDFTKLLKNQEDIQEISQLMYQCAEQKWVTFGSEPEWKNALEQTEGILRIKVICSLTKPLTEPFRPSRTDNLPKDFFSGPLNNFVI